LSSVRGKNSQVSSTKATIKNPPTNPIPKQVIKCIFVLIRLNKFPIARVKSTKDNPTVICPMLHAPIKLKTYIPTAANQ
jgi:hypothetical protein